MAEERMRKLIKYIWVNRQGETYQRESYQLQQREALPILNDLRQQEMRYSVATSRYETQVLSHGTEKLHIYPVYHADEQNLHTFKRSHDFATGLAPIAQFNSKIILPPFLFSTKFV